jgi:Cdc6-like AAA superfamily ATPase
VVLDNHIDDIVPELAHCVLAVERGQFGLAHAEFSSHLAGTALTAADISMSSGAKQTFGAYVAAWCFVKKKPILLPQILDERWKSEILNYAIAFFEPAVVSGSLGSDAATRIVSFVRSLESDLSTTNHEAATVVEAPPPPQPRQTQIWDVWIKDSRVQQFERDLNDRGLKIVKMNNYVRFSNSKLILSTIDEFMKLAEQEVRKATLLALETTPITTHGSSRQPRVPAPGLNSMLAELESLIGLTAVKNNVRSLVNLVRVRQMRAEQGLPIPDVSLHMVFAGNPGTGKTTVARLIANLYAQIGILKRGQLVEVDRAGLVAGFVGQTAIKTTEVIQRSLDGVLFIDEAYSLAERGSHDFGNEAIETLLKDMEDSRGRLIVIVAGYSSRMAAFINSNPGLKSRFSRVVEFPDYTALELLLIADHMAEQNNFLVEHDARDALGIILGERSSQSDGQFGNARGVRNLFEAILDAQANRIVKLDTPNRIELQTIKLEAVLSATR